MYGAVAGITAFGALSGLAAQSASAAVTANNLYGADRYQTAGNLNAAKFGSTGVSTALLADAMPGTPPTGAGGHQSDALAVSGYAGLNKYGLLLTDNTNTVPANTMTALANNKVKNIIAVGGTASVTPQQVAQLTAAGYTVTQPFQGADRYATMQMVNSQFTAGNVGTDPSGNKTAILASGDYSHLVDALAAGGLAYKWKFPVLLTPSGSSTLGSQASQEISTLGIKHLIVVGGTASIPASQYTPNPSGVTTVDVIAGADRSATARALEQLEVKTYGASTTTVGVATGATYYGTTGTVQNDGADALSGAPFNGDFEALCLSAGPGPNDAGSAPACVSDVNPTTANVETGPANLKSLSTILAGSGTTGAVSLTPTSGAPGTVVNGTVNNPGSVSNVSVAGCGLSQTFTPSSSPGASNFNSSTGAFSFSIPTSQPAGTCNLTVTVGTTNGQSSTQTIPFTVSSTTTPGQVTEPQLVSAKVLATTTPSQANGSTTFAGTMVQYVFNQPLTAANGAGAAALNSKGFHVYNASGDRFDASNTCAGGVGTCAFVDTSNPNAADVVFTNTAPTAVANAGSTGGNLQSSAGAGLLTLAAIGGPQDLTAGTGGAAVTNGNGPSPDGSAAIGSGTGTSLVAHTTAAPDLLSVGNARAANSTATSCGALGNVSCANYTMVDFTFDKAAYVVAPGGFHVVLTSPGSGNGGAAQGTELTCFAPQPGTSSPGSGGTIPGGNGTTVISADCQNNAALPPTSSTTLTTAKLARGFVAKGSVATASSSTCPASGGGPATTPAGSFCNPDTASSVNRQPSVAPDITGISVIPNTNGGTTDTMLFTFTEPVTNLVQGDFAYYLNSANETVCGAGCTLTQGSNTAQVAMNVGPAGSLSNAVGGVVTAGGVTGVNTSLTNADDEFGANNPNNATTSAGNVNAPQLKSVAIVTGTNSFGQTTYNVVYTFSTTVNNAAVPLATSNSFHFYDPDGTEFTCATAQTAGAGAVVGTGSSNATTVVCPQSAWVVQSPPASGVFYVAPNNGPGTAPTAGQFTAASLGTVDFGAVTSSAGQPSAGNVNPEGSSAVTH